MTPQEKSPQETPASVPKPVTSWTRDAAQWDRIVTGRLIVATAAHHGIRLRAAGDQIKAAPADRINAAMREYLKEYKPEVLEAIRYRDTMPAAFWTDADARGIRPAWTATVRVIEERTEPADAAPPAWVEKPKPAAQQMSLTAA